MITGRKLPELPPGTTSVIMVSGGTDEEAQAIIMLSIGRPQMEETKNGELVATHTMTVRGLLRLYSDLGKAISLLMGEE